MKIPFASFLSRVAKKAQDEGRSGSTQEDIVQELRSAFARIDSYGAEGSQQVNADEVYAPDIVICSPVQVLCICHHGCHACHAMQLKPGGCAC